MLTGQLELESVTFVPYDNYSQNNQTALSSLDHFWILGWHKKIFHYKTVVLKIWSTLEVHQCHQENGQTHFAAD